MFDRWIDEVEMCLFERVNGVFGRYLSCMSMW
jgi:hypothetical protein